MESISQFFVIWIALSSLNSNKFYANIRLKGTWLFASHEHEGLLKSRTLSEGRSFTGVVCIIEPSLPV